MLLSYLVVHSSLVVPHRPLTNISSFAIYRPGKGHTELEEELHETAHIDYDRVAIVRTPLSFHKDSNYAVARSSQ